MATFWVADGGNDGNDGESFAQAKATLAAGVALLSQGDTLNVVGSFAALSAGVDIDGTSLRGTSYSDPACIIQGTDSDGNPAMCTVTATGTSNHEWLDLANRPNYVIVRGFKFDATGMGNAVGQFIRTSGTGQFPFRVEYCQCLGNRAVSFFYAPEMVDASTSFSGSQEVDPALFEIRYCYLQDATVDFDNGFCGSVHHCVILFDSDYDFSSPETPVDMDTNASNLGPVQMWNCTFDMYYRGNTPRPGSVFQDYNASTNIRNDDRLLANNLFCFASSVAPDATGQCFTAGIISNGAAPTADVYSGTVGYNAFYFDAGFVAALTAVNSEIYNSYYNPDYPTTTEDSTEIYATDIRVDSATISEIINSTGAWTWTDLNGSGYEIDLPKDMRLTSTTLLTAGFDGGPVGAIEDLVNTAPVISGDVFPGFTVTEGETLVVTAGDSVETVCSDPDGDTLTYGVIDNVTHGTLTFNTTTGAFVYEADLNATGLDSFAFEACDGTTCTTYIVDTSQNPRVYITVEAIPVPPPTPEDEPDYPLVIDSLPFYRPVLKASASAQVRVQRNTNRRHIDFRHYLKDEYWNEHTMRYVQVNGSSSKELNLGGISGSTGLMLQTDQNLTVTVVWNTESGTDSFQATVSGCMMLDQVPVSSLSVSNTSSTTANVHLSTFE